MYLGPSEVKIKWGVRGMGEGRGRDGSMENRSGTHDTQRCRREPPEGGCWFCRVAWCLRDEECVRDYTAGTVAS